MGCGKRLLFVASASVMHGALLTQSETVVNLPYCVLSSPAGSQGVSASFQRFPSSLARFQTWAGFSFLCPRGSRMSSGGFNYGALPSLGVRSSYARAFLQSDHFSLSATSAGSRVVRIRCSDDRILCTDSTAVATAQACKVITSGLL